MKRIVWTIVLGIGGLVVAVAITLGALAFAGDVGGVVQPGLPRADRPSTASSPGGDDGGHVEGGSSAPSPSHEAGDDGGSGSDGSSSGSGSDGSSSGSGSDDSSGPGSGSDDHSGDDD